MTNSMFDPPTIDDVRLEDIADELRRELKIRRDVYPRWLASKKIAPHDAHWRILVLEAALRYITGEANDADG